MYNVSFLSLSLNCHACPCLAEYRTAQDGGVQLRFTRHAVDTDDLDDLWFQRRNLGVCELWNIFFVIYNVRRTTPIRSLHDVLMDLTLHSIEPPYVGGLPSHLRSCG